MFYVLILHVVIFLLKISIFLFFNSELITFKPPIGKICHKSFAALEMRTVQMYSVLNFCGSPNGPMVNDPPPSPPKKNRENADSFS